ncbi:hypothetical protein Agabi119p4_150 [Agaricus bisporus var. burnettii]|uniref:Uncharacterized protein n=1 Tax=Agaricus bisporus var. burnettii TaxID=192524 RepID=A0A8H7KKJ9_AGABI|nr:hypothetical protein Agabi119p4_150 [Agaricus bisporus var. burnettii]
MFRASPWVPYQPSNPPHQSTPMEDDVDMDAPQISTLPEEKSPPPRRKLIARKGADHVSTKPKSAEYPSWRQPQTTVTRGSDDEEEEEDQLIDDEDDVSGSKRKPTSVSKKKTPAKRKARKEPEAEEDGLKKRTKKDKASHPGKSTLVAPGLEATPSDSHDDGTGFNTGANTPSIAAADVEPPESISTSKPPKKKATPRKPAAPKTGKGKPSGLKMLIPPLSAIAPDDTASVMSEGGISGTAASSPVTGHFEKSQPASPDAEYAPASSPAPAPSAPLVEETNLENTPLPVYPLPSKPFPVQPPPKIQTGFAPPIPLDKSGKKVRRWRTAQREIRGIAGGRWFARSWVGDKDSEYAAFTKEGEKAGNGSPFTGKTQSNAPSGKGSGKKGKGASSLNASAAPSRDVSVNPPEVGGGAGGTSIPITSTVRAPTKMRIQQLPDDPQSDAAMDTDPVLVPPSES